MTESTPKAESHPVGTVLMIKSRDDLDVTFPSGVTSTFAASNGEVHVALHMVGTFLIGGKTVEAV